MSDRSEVDTDRDDRPERRRLGGIRLHLVGLALIAALPLAGLSVGRILSDRAEANATTNLESMRAARLVAARLDERIRSADALLLGLSTEMSMAFSRRTHVDSVLARAETVAGGGALTFNPLAGGLPPNLAWASLELFASDVLPALRPSPSGPGPNGPSPSS